MSEKEVELQTGRVDVRTKGHWTEFMPGDQMISGDWQEEIVQVTEDKVVFADGKEMTGQEFIDEFSTLSALKDYSAR